MTWDIRDAEIADLAALNAVYRRSSLSNDGDRALLLAHPEVLVLSAASLEQGRMRVAAVERTVVGFVTTSVHDDHLELDALFVDPDWMRRGIAVDLVRDASRSLAPSAWTGSRSRATTMPASSMHRRDSSEIGVVAPHGSESRLCGRGID